MEDEEYNKMFETDNFGFRYTGIGDSHVDIYGMRDDVNKFMGAVDSKLKELFVGVELLKNPKIAVAPKPTSLVEALTGSPPEKETFVFGNGDIEVELSENTASLFINGVLVSAVKRGRL